MNYLKNQIKENYIFLAIFLYVLSVFFLEIAQLFNRLSLVIIILISLVGYYQLRKLEYDKRALLIQFFIALPLIFSLILLCNSKLVSLNVTFLVFFLAFNSKYFKGEKTIFWIYKSLNISLVIVFVICLFGVGYHFFKNYFLAYPAKEAINIISETYWWNNFVHKSFVKILGMHPSYLSIFCLAAINWDLNVLLENIRSKEEKLDKGNLTFLSVITVFTILISSKMAYIVLFLLILLFLIRLVIAKLYKELVLVSSMGILLITLLYYMLPSIRDRVTVDYRNFKDSEFKVDNKSPASERIFIWKTSLDIVKENPLGIYCTSTKKAIWNRFDKANKSNLEEKNGHNNFLEFGLMYGWLGLFMLLLFTLYSFSIVIRAKDVVFGGVLLIFVLFSLVESTLVREAGVIYMAFIFQFHFMNLERLKRKDVKKV